QDDERKLFALESVFEEHPRAACAELVFLHEPANKRLGLRARFRHKDAFPRAQSIRLYDHRPIHGIERANGFGWGFKIAVERRCGDAVAIHKMLRVNLATFKPRVAL